MSYDKQTWQNDAAGGTPLSAARLNHMEDGIDDADTRITNHLADTANPHSVTKAQVGLANADNTSDANKPVSTATQTALDLKANDADVVHDTGAETIAGVKTFSSDPIIPDEAYGVGWNGSLEPPTKNAVYDKIETLGGGAAAIDDLTDVTITAAASGDFLRHNGTAWVDATLADGDIPATIARDSEVTTAISNHEAAADPHTGYQKESEKGSASGYASLDGSTKVPIAQIPTGTTSSTVSLGDHTHSLYEERALTMGKAGTVSATETDGADFLVVVPFNMTLKRIKVSRKTHGSAASVVQVRKSTDSGASYANAFGSATFGASDLVATADPADHNVSEGDVLNFSVSTGGGTNLLVELVAIAR